MLCLNLPPSRATAYTVVKKQAPASTTSDTGSRPRCLTPATDLVSSSGQGRWNRPSARLNIAQHPPASHPADRTTANGDTGQKRSPLAPETCTAPLPICRKTLAAYLQSMSQRQVSHSLPISTCDETEWETHREVPCPNG
jgi:hypothetical protein